MLEVRKDYWFFIVSAVLCFVLGCWWAEPREEKPRKEKKKKQESAEQITQTDADEPEKNV